ncbi:MAG: hypothetical protein HQL37_08255 [Alphaproteobacteria bacterium]|nr:hypothetical protein [Alphaproteobacteria bacterium]
MQTQEIPNSFVPGPPLTPSPTVLGKGRMEVIAPAFDDDLHDDASSDGRTSRPYRR